MTSLDIYLALIILILVALVAIASLLAGLNDHVNKLDQRVDKIQKTSLSNNLNHIYTRGSRR